MGDIIRRKIYIMIMAVMSVLMLTAALLCFSGIRSELTAVDTDAVITQVNPLVNSIETTQSYDFDVPYSYAVILADGDVIFNKNTSLGERVNTHSLGSADKTSYIVPYVKNGAFEGLIYVETSPYFCGRNVVGVILWTAAFTVFTAFSVIICIAAVRVVKNDIFSPVEQLHAATRDILGGKLDKPVRYDYDGEIGMLCHDFELMRKELSDGLKREQKMKDDEKLLMASISHDLKTPLATVSGYLESVCLGVVTDEKEVKSYCQSALAKTALLTKMTNDILEHSKAELHHLSVEPEEVFSAAYFGELINVLRSDAKSRGITLTCGEIPNLLISLDKTRIAQVMENIVGNSFKYGKENGTISISFAIANEFYIVHIKDDGQGISAEDLPFVFNKFFRGDKARTQSIPGSGLGLSIAQYIVEEHGGRIECDSIAGCGTEVLFCLKIS